MKVKDLIELLEEYGDHLEVVVRRERDNWDEYFAITGVDDFAGMDRYEALSIVVEGMRI